MAKYTLDADSNGTELAWIADVCGPFKCLPSCRARSEPARARSRRVANTSAKDVGQRSLPSFHRYKAEHYRGHKETSKRFYDSRIAAWIEPTFRDKKLYQISPLDVAQMLGAMEKAGVARNTRVATRAIVANIFKMARQWDYLKDADNPARDAEIGRNSGAARTIWTPTLEEGG